MGHSYNDRTRYSAALLSSNDGQVNLPFGANSYSGFFTASQAFDAGRWGVERVGFYAMAGEAPTTWLTSGGVPIGGSGTGNKGYHREGFIGQFYFGDHVDVTVMTQHGGDSAWFGQGYGDFIDAFAANPGVTTCPPVCNNTLGTTLPAGSQAPTWNGVLVEPHYVVSPQMIFVGRYETLRMSQQANGAEYPTALGGPSPSNLGNITTYTFGYRYNPFMTSRAGLAYHVEYNWLRQDGTSPVTHTNLTTNEVLTGIDFDF